MQRNRPLKIILSRSGKALDVPAERSILGVLLAAKVHIRHACHSGRCGACEVKVLAGVPEHLDLFYQQMSNPPCDRMKVCVSRAFTSELVIDI